MGKGGTCAGGTLGDRVGDLNSSIKRQHGTWCVFFSITVQTPSHSVLPDTVVTARWNDAGSTSCTTSTGGTLGFPDPNPVNNRNSRNHRRAVAPFPASHCSDAASRHDRGWP